MSAIPLPARPLRFLGCLLLLAVLPPLRAAEVDAASTLRELRAARATYLAELGRHPEAIAAIDLGFSVEKMDRQRETILSLRDES